MTNTCFSTEARHDALIDVHDRHYIGPLQVHLSPAFTFTSHIGFLRALTIAAATLIQVDTEVTTSARTR